jgi:hypothetical protein
VPMQSAPRAARRRLRLTRPVVSWRAPGLLLADRAGGLITAKKRRRMLVRHVRRRSRGGARVGRLWTVRRPAGVGSRRGSLSGPAR